MSQPRVLIPDMPTGIPGASGAVINGIGGISSVQLIATGTGAISVPWHVEVSNSGGAAWDKYGSTNTISATDSGSQAQQIQGAFEQVRVVIESGLTGAIAADGFVAYFVGA